MALSWFDKTRARLIRGEQFSESEIRAMRRKLREALNSASDSDKAYDLIDMVDERKPEVMASQARKGADWLHAQAFTPSGKVRKNAFVYRELTPADLAVIEACHANPRFQLVGFDVWEGSYGYINGVFPIYRCHGADGAWFDYVGVAWQSGGKSYVMRRGAK